MLSFFPLDVWDEIWDVIESVSEGSFRWLAEKTVVGDDYTNLP